MSIVDDLRAAKRRLDRKRDRERERAAGVVWMRRSGSTRRHAVNPTTRRALCGAFDERSALVERVDWGWEQVDGGEFVRKVPDGVPCRACAVAVRLR